MLTEATTTSTSSRTNATQILNTCIAQRNEKMEGSHFNSNSIENNIENCRNNNSKKKTASYKTVAQFVITNHKRNEHNHNYTNSSMTTKTSLAANSHNNSQRYETSTQLVHQHPLPASQQIIAATSSLPLTTSTTASVLPAASVDVTNGNLEKVRII